jgi:hypothetical protein
MAMICLLIFNRKSFQQIYVTTPNIGLLAVVGLAMSLWSQTGIIQTVVSGQEIIFRPCVDYFIHASMIQRLYEGSTLGRHQEFALMSGIPAPLYHYASYMFSSLLRAVSDLPAINIATAFWLPFGGILSGLGAFVFGNSMWGKKEGIVSALAITLLPDPYMCGCGLGYFSYHFLGQTGAANYYAEAIAAVGLGTLAQGIVKANSRIILAGLIPISTLVFFKAHIFIVVFPAACFWLILSLSRMSTTTKILGIILLSAAFGLVALLAWHLNYISLGKPWAIEFFRNIFSSGIGNRPRLHTTIFSLTQSTSTILDDVIVGTTMVWLGTLGPVLLGGVILIYYLKRKDLLNFRDMVPFLCLLFWTILILIMPANTNVLGRPDEFHHRPYHAVYYFFTIWVIARSANLFFSSPCRPSKKSGSSGMKSKFIPIIVSLSLLLIPLYFGKRVLNTGAWVSGLHDVTIDPGLWEASKFIRNKGHLGDVTLDSTEDKFHNIVCGVGERRLFLSEPYISRLSNDSPDLEWIEKKRRIHNQLRQCPTKECVGKIVRTWNIRWYLLHPGDKISWPLEMQNRFLFESNGYRVFDMYLFGHRL